MVDQGDEEVAVERPAFDEGAIAADRRDDPREGLDIGLGGELPPLDRPADQLPVGLDPRLDDRSDARLTETEVVRFQRRQSPP